MEAKFGRKVEKGIAVLSFLQVSSFLACECASLGVGFGLRARTTLGRLTWLHKGEKSSVERA